MIEEERRSQVLNSQKIYFDASWNKDCDQYYLNNFFMNMKLFIKETLDVIKKLILFLALLSPHKNEEYVLI
jgi:hypothetical protein